MPMLVLTISLYPIQFPKPKPLHLKKLPSMSGDQNHQKVVVCGGGVIGACTAYYLSKSSSTTTTSVTLIEKSSIADAASGKAGGFLALDWCDNTPLSDLARTSFNLHRSLSDELNGTQSYGYRPLTTLSLSISENPCTKTPVTKTQVPDWVNEQHLKTGPKTIGDVSTTAQVHPKLFCQTVVKAAVERYGVEVVVGEVEKVVEEDGRVKGVVVKGGRVVEADVVVLAMGPWCGRFGLLEGLFRVSGLKAHSIVLEPREKDLITPHALFLSYFPAGGGKVMDPEVYPRPTGEVYICGMSADAEVPDDPEQIVPDHESIKVLKRVAGTVSLHLREEEAYVKAEQACFLPCTDDSRPVIGELPNVKGCYVATGHNCWGILNGPATGAAMAELVLDGHANIVDLTPFSPTRFVTGRWKH